MFCIECGEQNSNDANFCQNCGKKFQKTTDVNQEFNEIDIPEGSVEDFRKDLDLLQKSTPELINYIDNYNSNNPQGTLKDIKAELEERKAKIGNQLKVIDINILKIDYVPDVDDSKNMSIIINADEEKLQNYVDYYKQKALEEPKELWTDKCPVCRNGNLFFHDQKGLLGLKTDHVYECEDCGAVFKQKGNKYQLIKVSNQSNPIWVDYGRSELSEKEWTNIANGGISDKKQEDADINSWLTDAKEGLINFADTDAPVILKKNENAILVLNGISFFEPRAVRNTRGTYGGPSFRVAKGVSFRLGSFAAQSVSHEELKQIDIGTLTLTNKRMIFTGSKRTTNIDLRKIIAIEPFKDGIASQRENKQKTEHFNGINNTILNITANGRNYTWPVNGIILKCIIEGLIKNIS